MFNTVEAYTALAVCNAGAPGNEKKTDFCNVLSPFFYASQMKCISMKVCCTLELELEWLCVLYCGLYASQ